MVHWAWLILAFVLGELVTVITLAIFHNAKEK